MCSGVGWPHYLAQVSRKKADLRTGEGKGRREWVDFLNVPLPRLVYDWIS